MSTPKAQANSTRKKDPHYFQAGGDWFMVQLIKGNYDQIKDELGFSLAEPAPGTQVTALSAGKAAQEALLIPMRIKGNLGGRPRSATVYVPRSKLEDIFTGAGALKGKKYKDWTIDKVSPVMKRVISL